MQGAPCGGPGASLGLQAPAAQQGAIGGVLYQGVLELVLAAPVMPMMPLRSTVTNNAGMRRNAIPVAFRRTGPSRRSGAAVSGEVHGLEVARRSPPTSPGF
jgi:hypothetical protein